MKQAIWTLGLCMGLLLAANPAMAQSNDSSGGECSNGLCGTPDQSGGGCGCGCGSILIAMTDRGDSYQFADDFDGDGIEDEFDNCPFAFNYDQGDGDGDGAGDSCDVCPAASDPFQEDLDGDRSGDACDTDRDGDGVLNDVDNCAGVPNLAQANFDADPDGDACDLDDDNDGLLDTDPLEDCRLGVLGQGACDDDEDGDEIFGADDNCPSIYNPEQSDLNSDGFGDFCDSDMDGDGFENWKDNCRGVANPTQLDLDLDGLGDGGAWSGPESCDPTECYVIAGDSQGCLNPNLAFTIKLGLIKDEILAPEILVGNKVIVPIFTNRLGANHTWEARLAEAPSDSEVILKNGRGSATTMMRNGFNSPQVANCLSGDASGCTEYNLISFEPDAPGRYVIEVTAELPGGDALGAKTTARIVADVGGEKAGGCQSAGASGMFAAMALGFLAFVRRRR